MAKYRVNFDLRDAWQEWIVESDDDIDFYNLNFLELVDGGNSEMTPTHWEKMED